MENKNLPFNHISRDRESLIEYITLLLTDGYVYHGKKASEIGFVNNSEVLRIRFATLSNELFQKKCTASRSMALVPRLRFYSRTVAAELSDVCTFRTKKKNDKYPVIQFPYLRSKSEMKIVLRTAFTTDGAIVVNLRKFGNKTRIEPNLKLSCENPSLQKIFSEFLEAFGISHKIYKNGISIRKTQSISAFNYIGFLPDVKIGRDSRRFCGYTKQELFTTICHLIKNKMLYPSKNKQETETFIKQLMARQAGAKLSQCAQA